MIHTIQKSQICFFVILFSLFSVGGHISLGQTVESDERALLNVDEGIGFSKDSLFLMNLRFRMQNRAGFNTLDGDDFSINEFEMRVRRLRLRFDGFILNPKFQYYIQLGFSKADLDLESSNVAQPLRDAIVYYFAHKNFYFGFGQSKLPGNRQRVISSGNLQFADRSIANAAFTIDRDFGFFGYFTKKTGDNSFMQLKGAITTGEGRNASKTNNGLAYTGRVEFLPFGLFTNNGDYSEGDIEFEENPKLAIGLTFSRNLKASRTGGQLGMPLFENRNLNSFIADGVFKYRGNSILMEYFQRKSSNPITSNDEGDIRFVQVGQGLNVQISKMMSRKSEVAVRYSYVLPDRSISEFQSRVDEALIGYTYYINGHRIKLQGNVGYKWLEGLSGFENAGNSWTGMFQVEFGI
ncbi:OprO/OprP family phosphate-selective porin [Aquiflexum sp. LQ15W]|uniref:porin n=1 Tax=Cognataquiflexum nitidum TaxID=2922272 RepID=UPI001F141B93|nr:porin [Cognataquiflexum nitidum]MCH6200929.1 OprO/OprP family phosphate-selective porin [Cognataquiflexum nitidum]